MDDDRHINALLWQLAWDSGPVQLAHKSLTNELAKYGLECEPGERLQWEQFVSDVVYELLLYGYCVHRKARAVPYVLSGRYVEIRRKGVGHPWAPRVFDPGRFNMKGTAGWRVCVVNAPLETPDGGYSQPTSPMMRALPSVAHHRTLVANMLKRDHINSSPAVFTTVSDRVNFARTLVGHVRCCAVMRAW